MSSTFSGFSEDSSRSAFAAGSDDNDDDDNNNLETMLRLRLYAANLPRRGNFRNRMPDSFALVTASVDASRTLATGGVQLGTTEVVHSSQNPQWTETFTLNYRQGSELYFNVLILEPNDDGESYSKSDGFGSAVFEVGDILGTKHRTRGRRLRRGGVVFCRLDPVQQATTQRFAVFRMAARNLVVPHRKFKVFSASPDTVLRISKQDTKTCAWTTVYLSQPVRDSFNPAWDRIEVDLDTLCDGNMNTPLRFHVSMVREHKKAIQIGTSETTLGYLMDGASSRTGSTLPDPDDESLPTFTLQRNLEKRKPAGQLVVRRAYLYEVLPDGTQQPINGFVNNESEESLPSSQQLTDQYTHDRRYSSHSILEPMVGASTSSLDASVASDLKSVTERGCDLQVFCAIDFTSSNGDPRLESSLHFQSASLNVYEETIATIVGSLEEQIKITSGYTVWGFGAKFGDGIVRHIFQCGNGTCEGVTGILDAYKNIFSLGFTMSGPTCFDKVLQAAAVRAQRSKQQGNGGRFQYNVLLIITDGTMSDMDETRRKMDVYRALPLSIIFVGVGRADMRRLAILCEEFRDQSVFVDFREKQSNPAELANAALNSLPRQILRYMEDYM